MQNNKMFFESEDSNSDVSATLEVGVGNKTVSIAVKNADIDIAVDRVVANAIEEMLNDMFNSPNFLFHVMKDYYPGTFDAIWNGYNDLFNGYDAWRDEDDDELCHLRGGYIEE
jgi:hypothetical protein